MSDQMLLAGLVGPLLLILGLSILLYTDVWRKLVSEWEKNHFVVFGMMVFNIVFGLVIINLHNVWEWSPYVVVTIAGWGAFLKGAFYFLLPGDHFKALAKKTNSKEIYQVTGVVAAFFGAWLSYLVYLV